MPIVVAAVTLFVSWRKLGITSEDAALAMNGILLLILVIGGFTLTSIFATVFSWMDYRKEETELLNRVVGSGFRRSPKWHNAWRWPEIYTAVFILAITVFLFCFFSSYSFEMK